MPKNVSLAGLSPHPWRLARARLALPSALMGLVAFSFTLVAFGAAVYTAALPSLVQQAEQTRREVAQERENAVEGGDQAEDGQAGEAEGGADGASGKSSAGGAKGSVGIGTLSGIKAPTGSTTDSSSTNSAGQTSSTEGNTSQNGAGTGSGSTSGSDTGSDSTPEEETPSSGPTEAQEQAAYEFLSAKAALVNGYLTQANACSSSFSADCLSTDRAVREKDRYAVRALTDKLLEEYDAVTNTTLVLNESRYADAKGSLIGMYRCLAQYTSAIESAWDANLQYDDPAAHQSEFMAIANGASTHMNEFNSYASGFKL